MLKLEWHTEALDDGRTRSQADCGGYLACVESFGQSVGMTYWAAFIRKAGLMPVEEPRPAWSNHDAESLVAAQEAAEAAAARLLANDVGVRALAPLIGDALTTTPTDEPLRGLVDFIAVHVERDALRAKVAELEAALRWIPVTEGLPPEVVDVQVSRARFDGTRYVCARKWLPARPSWVPDSEPTPLGVWSFGAWAPVNDADHWRPLDVGPVAATSADSANLAATASGREG
jgi:hypothetical protein